MLRLWKRPGRPHWYVRGTVRGTRIKESTGTDRRELAEALRIKREGELLNRSVYGAKAVATFGEAVVSFIEAGGDAKELGRLTARFGMTPLGLIGQSAIDSAALELHPTASPSTRLRHVYAPMSAVLRHAAKRGLCDPLLLDRPKPTKSVIRWLRPEEAERLIGACAPHLAPLVVFLLGTGARLGEALDLLWHDLDLTAGRVTFRHTKNGDSRGVPLESRVLATLASLPHRDGIVFLTPAGRPYSARTGSPIKTAFRAACRRAGVTNCRVHDLRHTWASWHYQRNRDLTALMALGGWKSAQMVMRYAHANPDQFAAGMAVRWAKQRA